MRRLTKEAFLSKVKINSATGCWDWQGHIHQSGYGYAKHFDSGLRRTHRISWYLHYGDFDRSLYVLHRCDNRACVNPDHLFLGTHQDNMDDMIRKGRRASFKGSRHGMSILNEDIVLKMRECLKESGTREVAKLFNISEPTVSMIKNRKTWKHI